MKKTILLTLTLLSANYTFSYGTWHATVKNNSKKLIQSFTVTHATPFNLREQFQLNPGETKKVFSYPQSGRPVKLEIYNGNYAVKKFIENVPNNSSWEIDMNNTKIKVTRKK